MQFVVSLLRQLHNTKKSKDDTQNHNLPKNKEERGEETQKNHSDSLCLLKASFNSRREMQQQTYHHQKYQRSNKPKMSSMNNNNNPPHSDMVRNTGLAAWLATMNYNSNVNDAQNKVRNVLVGVIVGMILSVQTATTTTESNDRPTI